MVLCSITHRMSRRHCLIICCDNSQNDLITLDATATKPTVPLHIQASHVSHLVSSFSLLLRVFALD